MSGVKQGSEEDVIVEEATDDEVESLLHRVYVDGGFTPKELATSLFSAAAVRARGNLLVARGPARDLLGMVVLVMPTSPARRIAVSDEVEMHLLAVLPEHRGRGTGARLVEAAIGRASERGWKRMVLWTQPSMHAAQRLYEAHGFVRAVERDAQMAKTTGRVFLVFERGL